MPELNSISDPLSRRFVERLSSRLIMFGAIGAMFVLIDPVLTIQLANGATLKLGGNGFADQMKGAVLTLMLIAGFTAAVQYWFGASNQGDKAQESVNNIAAAAAPAQAAAVAAATGTGNGAAIRADNVDVVAGTATVTERNNQ